MLRRRIAIDKCSHCGKRIYCAHVENDGIALYRCERCKYEILLKRTAEKGFRYPTPKRILRYVISRFSSRASASNFDWLMRQAGYGRYDGYQLEPLMTAAERAAQTLAAWSYVLSFVPMAAATDTAKRDAMTHCIMKMEGHATGTMDWLLCIQEWERFGNADGVCRCRLSYYRAELIRTLPAAPQSVIEDVSAIAIRKDPGATPLHDFLRHQLIAYVRHNYTNYDALLAGGAIRDVLRRTLHSGDVDRILAEWASQRSGKHMITKGILAKSTLLTGGKKGVNT